MIHSPTPRSLTAFAAGSLLVIAMGCSSTPTKPTGTLDPSLESKAKREQEHKKALRAKQDNFERVVLALDQALSEFAINTAKSESDKAARRAVALREFIELRSKKYAADLLGYLGAESPRRRAIAAAALGFTRDENFVNAIANRLGDPESYVRTNAAFGLGIMADPARTPLTDLKRIASNYETNIEERRSATWALLQLQVAGADKKAIAPIWRDLLSGDVMQKDEMVLVHALRGLGLLRDPGVLDDAARYLSHPKAFIRTAAIIAAARTTNRRAAKFLIPILGVAESNPNVQLAARKGLKALTGNRVDFEKDVRSWQNEFKDVLDGQ